MCPSLLLLCVYVVCVCVCVCVCVHVGSRENQLPCDDQGIRGRRRKRNSQGPKQWWVSLPLLSGSGWGARLPHLCHEASSKVSGRWKMDLLSCYLCVFLSCLAVLAILKCRSLPMSMGTPSPCLEGIVLCSGAIRRSSKKLRHPLQTSAPLRRWRKLADYYTSSFYSCIVVRVHCVVWWDVEC